MADATGLTPHPTTRRRIYLELFAVSFLLLFLELACIRWFSSTVIFLTFFTNLVLLACFLGMSVGLLAANRGRDYFESVIPLTLLVVLAACGTYWGYTLIEVVTIDVGGQGSPQEVFFGTETRPRDPSQFILPIEVVIGLFFVLIALMFVGLGQKMGRAFNGLPDRVAAYSVNILGSLVGIAAFGLASYLRTPPVFWFGIGLVGVFALDRKLTFLKLLGLIGVPVAMVFMDRSEDPSARTVWSPYYKVQYNDQSVKETRDPVQLIHVNNITHQGMLNLENSGLAYTLPHLLNRDAGGPPFENVLVIGAGSGNDVQGALMSGARRVDAVEIDPVIREIGVANHPNQPYSDPRVSVHLEDGRSYVRKTDRKYDLVIYAMVDSLVLHSGYSSLRLESFLFTEQAFRDIKNVLKPGGVFVMYNHYRQGWVVTRLQQLAEEVFGGTPVVISLPYQETIQNDPLGTSITMLMVGNSTSEVVGTIRDELRENAFYWAHRAPRNNQEINAYGKLPPYVLGTNPPEWMRIGPARVDSSLDLRVPTDDWPFLYLRDPIIPALNLRGMALVAGLTLVILFVFAPKRAARPDGRMFFLGAGFMLLETKGVVHMALLFGSTWVVNSFVFAAILVMILLANLYVLAVQPRRLWPYYILLGLGLLANIAVPMETYLALPGAARVLASCAVVFVPVLFAGIIFATVFRDTTQPDAAYGSNIAGAILGGLSENLSLVIGFNNLLILAAVYYAGSALFGIGARRTAPTASDASAGEATA